MFKPLEMCTRSITQFLKLYPLKYGFFFKLELFPHSKAQEMNSSCFKECKRTENLFLHSFWDKSYGGQYTFIGKRFVAHQNVLYQSFWAASSYISYRNQTIIARSIAESPVRHHEIYHKIQHNGLALQITRYTGTRNLEKVRGPRTQTWSSQVMFCMKLVRQH